jgi:hypothetical protein
MAAIFDVTEIKEPTWGIRLPWNNEVKEYDPWTLQEKFVKAAEENGVRDDAGNLIKDSDGNITAKDPFATYDITRRALDLPAEAEATADNPTLTRNQCHAVAKAFAKYMEGLADLKKG